MQRGPEVFASIVLCRPFAVQALGHMAVFHVRTLIGVPALAFARWSHPTLFAPRAADKLIPGGCDVACFGVAIVEVHPVS